MLFNSIIYINIAFESRLHCIDIIAYHCSTKLSAQIGKISCKFVYNNNAVILFFLFWILRGCVRWTFIDSCLLVIGYTTVLEPVPPDYLIR